jgi:hypothetical protein
MSDQREQIQELFIISDTAQAAVAAGKERIARLQGRHSDLTKSLPVAEKTIRSLEAAHRDVKAKMDVHEATPEEVAAASAAIEGAKNAVAETKERIASLGGMIEKAQGELPHLNGDAQRRFREAWKAVEQALEPEAQQAALVLRRHFAAKVAATNSTLVPSKFDPWAAPPEPDERAALLLKIEKDFRG